MVNLWNDLRTTLLYFIFKLKYVKCLFKTNMMQSTDKQISDVIQELVDCIMQMYFLRF
jgi:regulator of sigma D